MGYNCGFVIDNIHLDGFLKQELRPLIDHSKFSSLYSLNETLTLGTACYLGSSVLQYERVA